jgi:hypothetical protein
MEIDEHKQRLNILILGPYRPKSCLSKLQKLQDHLRNVNFVSTKLVKDFPDNQKFSNDIDEHFTKKSRLCINTWAHVPIFVFFKEADNLGVNTELTFTCLNLPNNGVQAAVFFEQGLDVSTQVRGSIKIAKISFEIFSSQNELCQLAFGHCLKALDKLYWYL